MHCPQVFVFAGAVGSARSSFHVRKCCIHFPLVFSCSQVLYTLPAQVIVFASVVYTSRSSFRGRKCCIHCPLIGFVVLASLYMLALASVARVYLLVFGVS